MPKLQVPTTLGIVRDWDRYCEEWAETFAPWPGEVMRKLVVQELSRGRQFAVKNKLKPVLCVGLLTAFILSAWHRIMKTGIHIKPRPEPGELVNTYTSPPPVYAPGTRPEKSFFQREAHEKTTLRNKLPRGKINQHRTDSLSTQK